MSTYYEFYAAAEKDGKIEAIGPYRNVLVFKRLTFLLLQNPECILFVIDESVLPHGGELAGQGTSVGANVICQFDASQRERDVAAVLLLGLH